eukprot:m.260392 g.260392  ORF g.260392 m.260392 type:complete len:315 (+) comp19679_c0_seq1:275-1219(+)
MKKAKSKQQESSENVAKSSSSRHKSSTSPSVARKGKEKEIKRDRTSSGKKRGFWRRSKKKHASIFAVPLTDAVYPDGVLVPVVLRMLIQFIDQHGLDKLGLYSSNSSITAISLRNTIEEDPSFWLETDANFGTEDKILAASQLVRMFLREQDVLLEESPELADAIDKELESGSTHGPDSALLDLATSELAKVSAHSYTTMAFVCRHAQRVLAHASSNGMLGTSLASMLAEDMRMRQELLTFLIGNSDEVFDADDDDGGSDAVCSVSDNTAHCCCSVLILIACPCMNPRRLPAYARAKAHPTHSCCPGAAPCACQ